MYVKRTPRWPDPRVKPPYGAAEVDWGHALAAGLSAAWVLNEAAGTRVYDMTRQWPGTLAGTPPPWTVTSRGLGVSMNGTSGSDRLDAGDIPFDNNNWTIAISLIAGALDGAYRRFAGWDNGGPTIWREVEGGGTTWGIVHGGTVDFNTVTGKPADNERFSAAIARQSSNALIVKNGIVQASTSAFSATYTLTGNTFRVGTGNNNSENTPGTFIYAYVWGTRGLSASDLAWVNAEPNVLFRPIIRRRYSVPAAAAAGSRSGLLLLGVGR